MNVYVLSLKSAQSRRDYMTSILNKSNIEFQFVDSLSPCDLEEIFFESIPYYLSKEAVATFETHRKVLKIVADSDDICLILEDDATPTKDEILKEIQNLLQTEIDFDIMLIGYENQSKKDCHFKNNLFYRFNKFIGLHSYIVKPEGAKKILSLIGDSNDHIDRRISNLISNNKISGIFSKNKIFEQNKSDFISQIPKNKNKY